MIASDDPRPPAAAATGLPSGSRPRPSVATRTFRPSSSTSSSSRIDGEVEVVDALAAQLPARMTRPAPRLPGGELAGREELVGAAHAPRRRNASDPAIEMARRPACMEFNQQLDGDGPGPTGVPDGRPRLGLGQRRDGAPTKVFNETGLFIAGGAETTRTAIAHGLRAFADHPDQWEPTGRRTRRSCPPRSTRSSAGSRRSTTSSAPPSRTPTIGGQAVADGRPGDPALPVGQPGRGRVRRPLHASTSPATRTRTWPSATAPTSASGPTSPSTSCGILFAELTRRFTDLRGRHRARRRAQHLRPGRPHLPPRLRRPLSRPSVGTGGLAVRRCPIG